MFGIRAQRLSAQNPKEGDGSRRQRGQKESVMRTGGFALLAVVLAGASALLSAGAARAQQAAITATVAGEAIQKVGFRAMIQREAIMDNLAGSARNNPDGTVTVTLQGS